MKTYSIALGDKQVYDRFRYPAGEMQVRLNPKIWDEITDADAVSITARIRTSEDIIETCMLCDAVRGDSNRHIDLIVPYLPYARADRRFVDGDCYALEVFANLLNSLNVTVITLDAHSAKSRSTVHRLIDVSPLPFVEKAIVDCLKASDSNVSDMGLTLLFPDDGAQKRYSSMATARSVEILHCQKSRNKATGKLSGFSVPALSEFKTKQVLLIDDICDGGGTFMGIADGLKDYGLNLALYVTHGIFSKGIEPLLTRFRTLYTTDSFDNHLVDGQLIVYPTATVLAEAVRTNVWDFSHI